MNTDALHSLWTSLALTAAMAAIAIALPMPV
ncbi:MAG: hypothetical protein RJA98_982 [Pseudomonadota bacterium]|jgi:hypothetical protein